MELEFLLASGFVQSGIVHRDGSVAESACPEGPLLSKSRTKRIFHDLFRSERVSQSVDYLKTRAKVRQIDTA